MKNHVILGLLMICLCASASAEEATGYPRVSFVAPGGDHRTVSRDDLVILVVEGPYVSYEKNAISDKRLVEYVNSLLKLKKVSYLGVYCREGVKYGELLTAIDALRKTDAKEIGVSMIEVPAGREP